LEIRKIVVDKKVKIRYNIRIEIENLTKKTMPSLTLNEGIFNTGRNMENTGLLIYFVFGLLVFKAVFIVSFICINMGLCKKKEEHGKEF
jgi:hypothetical protein